MTTQLQISFTSQSPINTFRLSGQNERLFRWLMDGNKINCMSPAMSTLRIGYLNSRSSDLINKYKIPVEKKYITVKDSTGEEVLVKEYSLSPESINKLKSLLEVKQAA